MKRNNRVAFFNILSTLLLRGISIFTAPLFSRLLGDSGYGILSIYNIWTSALAIVLTLQTQGTLVSARVEYPEEEHPKYYASAMSMSVCFFLLCSFLILLFIEPISKLIQLDRILIVLMLIQAFGTFCVSFLNTKFVYEFKAGRNMAMSLTISLVSLTAALVMILQLPHETRYFGRILANSATYGAIGIPVCIYILAKGRTFCNKRYWKFCLALAIPMVFYNLSDLILGQSDRVMLQRMLSSAAVGQYSLALNFAGIMFTIFGALNNSWCPFFFEDMKQGRIEEMQKQSKNFLELFTVLSVGFILLTTEVYHVFASREFWPGTSLIPIFVGSYYINFLCTFPVNYEYFHRKTKIVAVITISSSVMNIALNWVLIQRLGMAGAALATFLSHCMQLCMHHVYCRWVLKGWDYPFPVKLWAGYAVVYLGAAALVWLTEEASLLRWGIGAVLGIWELYRIKQRKVLI